jgi:hypothetical protein
MNVEYACAEIETLDDRKSRELLESERAWDEWMQEVFAILDAQSPQPGQKSVPGFAKQVRAYLLDD